VTTARLNNSLDLPHGVRRFQNSRVLEWLLSGAKRGPSQLAGTAAGIPLTLAVTSAASAMLFGVSAADLSVVAMAAAILLTATMAAGLIPARRASLVDPSDSLRHD
jgi:hypothetical protein